MEAVNAAEVNSVAKVEMGAVEVVERVDPGVVGVVTEEATEVLMEAMTAGAKVGEREEGEMVGQSQGVMAAVMGS